MNLHVVARNPIDAHKALVRAYQEIAKPETIAGNAVEIIVRRAMDERSLRQLRMYWGPVLRDISEQASIAGQKYSKDAWHELFKRQFLPRKVTKTRVAGKKRMVVSVSIGSTKGLSVQKMSDYLEKIFAFAATDLGVVFSERDWKAPFDDQPAYAAWPASRAKAVIDLETGEIT